MNFSNIVRIAYSLVAALAAAFAAYFVFALLAWIISWLIIIVGTVFTAATVYNWSTTPEMTIATAAVVTGLTGAISSAGLYTRVSGMFRRSEPVAA